MKPKDLLSNYPRTVVAMVTPIKDGKIDEENLKKMVRFHLLAETPAVLVCGTTGESATMSHNEHKRVIELAVEAAREYKEGNPSKPVSQIWAGTGSNSTSEALDLTTFAEKAGADVALVITPYYNKPSPQGMKYHFRTLADAVEMPIVMYNVPGRTGINLLPSIVADLAGLPNIVGVKEASGNVGQISQIAAETPDDFLVWSGDDGLTLPILSVGGVGVISVTANIVPWDVEAVVQAYEVGDVKTALKLHQNLARLHKTLFIETNPIPVKTAVKLIHEACKNGVPEGLAAQAGKLYGEVPPVGEFRPPMVPLTDENLAALKQCLRDYDLLP